MKRIGILISGRGSNMISMLDAMDRGEIPARCAVVISNRADAKGLEAAADRGIPTVVVDHKESKSRKEHDTKMLHVLVEHGVQFVCLAGYMRILSPVLVRAFEGRLLNIHPALLPSFPGMHVQQKALDHGVRFSGCTVHFVDEEVDHGPILLQAVVPILPGDDDDSLSARILRYEHRLYPLALKFLCEGKIVWERGRAEIRMGPDEYRSVTRNLMDTGELP